MVEKFYKQENTKRRQEISQEIWESKKFYQ